jgi:hypothetical protein
MDINTIAARHHTWVERMDWHNKSVLEALAIHSKMEVNDARGTRGRSF